MAVYKNDANLEILLLFENDLTDESVNENDLTNTDVVFDGDSKEGSYSGDFESGDPSSGSITDASQVGLDITGDISICFWFKPETDERTHYLVGKSGANGDEGYLIQTVATDRIYFRLSDDGSSQTTAQTPASAISAATWVHVACVYNGVDMRVYIDGSLASNGAENPKAYVDDIYDTDVIFIVGGRSDKPGSFTDGLLDELAVFSRALSAAEVADIEANGIQDAPGHAGRLVQNVPLKSKISGGLA